MANYNVANTADLIRYVGLAQDGDVILLDPGSYSGAVFQNLAKAGNVTITSLDPSQPAVITDLLVRDSQGLTFTDLEMFATTDAAFQITGSSRIAFDRVDVHGILNGSSNDDTRAMQVRSSSNVSVTNSYFHEVTDAISHINSQNLNFSGNRFDLIRDNGISGGGSSYVTISNNVFTNFDHVGQHHPDAIQFWTNLTSVAATDITVSGNLFDRGTGGIVQGIFIQDEYGQLPYRNVTVTDNVIVGAMYNGIAIRGAVNATVTNNTVIGTEDQTSWISIFNVASATLSGNIASAWSFTNSTITGSGDIKSTSMTMADAAINSAALAGVALPGQMTGVLGQYLGWVLAEVTQLGYIDGPPSAGGRTFSVTQMDGTAGNDVLRVPSVGNFHLMGYDGNDSLVGGQTGGNFLEGGLGDDSYTIYHAGDTVVELAGEGIDSVYSYVSYTMTSDVENSRAMAGGLTLRGNAQDNSLSANAAGSVLYGDGGHDTVQGAAGADTLFGDVGNDRLFGSDGNDRLDGGIGDDKLYGGNGVDTMLGGDGIDTFEGGTGADVLTGGLGADMFVFRTTDFTTNLAASQDTITDFSAAQGDKIGLSGIDANRKTAADNAFTFIGNQGFHGVAGELRFAVVSGGIMLYGDTNGDRVADLQLRLNGISTITSSSFIL